MTSSPDRRPLSTCAAGLVVAAALGCGSGTPPCGPSHGVVAEAIDGDTIVLASGEHVRYLLVNTPETTSGKLDCYGPEATDFNRALVTGKEVALTYDTECKDRYGRLLAYVTVDGRDVNALLVERGYACVLFIPPDGQARKAQFDALAAQAKTDKRGLWGACLNPCK